MSRTLQEVSMVVLGVQAVPSSAKHLGWGRAWDTWKSRQAAANTPFLTLEYRPKCLDFASSVDWQSYALRTDAASAGQITELVSRMLSELPSLRQRLCESMCGLSAQFERYCALIEPLLIPGTRRAAG